MFDLLSPTTLIVGVLIALCAGLVGVPLVLKRYSFIGEGLSHVAFTGMAFAMVINLANNILIVMPLTVIVSVFFCNSHLIFLRYVMSDK